jgi:hypothetical protein
MGDLGGAEDSNADRLNWCVKIAEFGGTSRVKCIIKSMPFHYGQLKIPLMAAVKVGRWVSQNWMSPSPRLRMVGKASRAFN